MATVPIRPLLFFGDVALVPLTSGLVAVIDAADAHHADGRNWHATRSRSTYYARSNGEYREDGSRASYILHRLIIGAAKGVEVDHADGNGLNNCRSNLREATGAQNRWNARRRKDNQSGYKGVTKQRNRWVARITLDKRLIQLGAFASAEEAHAAYARAAKELHGKFARLS